TVSGPGTLALPSRRCHGLIPSVIDCTDCKAVLKTASQLSRICQTSLQNSCIRSSVEEC
ncbi:Hypothetical predicted protein, partial [Podarcis lilfordi]